MNACFTLIYYNFLTFWMFFYSRNYQKKIPRVDLTLTVKDVIYENNLVLNGGN